MSSTSLELSAADPIKENCKVLDRYRNTVQLNLKSYKNYAKLFLNWKKFTSAVSKQEINAGKLT